MKITKNKVLVGLVLLTLAAAVVLGLRSVGMSGPVEEAEPAEWTAQEQLATPLPTLEFGEEPSQPWALLGTLGLLMLAMVGLLVIGIFAAVLMVRLRNKIIER